MNRQQIKRLILSMSLLLALLPGVMAETMVEPIKMGIFPRRNPIVTTRMFTPLVQYLNVKLGRDVLLDTPKDFETFWNKVKNNEYDIVHYNQYHYVKSHKEYGYRVVAKNIEFNQDTIAGAIIVRKDANINSVTDLKGRKIVFGGGPRAMQSYIVAKYLLQINGLKNGEYDESFSTNPPNAIMSTYFKQSDAAGAGDKVLKLKIVESQIDINEMKYLVKGEQLSHLPWAVSSKLDNDTTKKLSETLLGMDKSGEGKTILSKMHMNGFAPAEDKDYDPHRIIIETVLHEKY